MSLVLGLREPKLNVGSADCVLAEIVCSDGSAPVVFDESVPHEPDSLSAPLLRASARDLISIYLVWSSCTIADSYYSELPRPRLERQPLETSARSAEKP